MGRIAPTTTSRLPPALALLVGSALGLAVAIGVGHLLFTSSPDRLFPRPLYSLKPVPGTSRGPSPYESAIHPGAAGADFSQIYYGARGLLAGRSPYAKPTPDPFGRRPGYAPLTYWITVPLTALPYDVALLVHTVAQLGVFVAATVVALRLTDTLSHLPVVMLTVVPLLLLTPVGLAYLERGQFDLYVATSYLLAFTYLFTPRVSLVMVAGVLAALKWSGLPMVGTLALFVLVAGPRGSRRFWLLAVPLIAAASVLLLPDTRFFGHLQYWERGVLAQGVSFSQVMDAWRGKVLPFLSLLAVAGVLRWRHRRSEPDHAVKAAVFPLAVALTVEGIGFGTVAFEYRAVSLLGLVPALAIWVERARGVPAALRAMTVVGFGLFLVVAFRVHNLAQPLPLEMVVWIYLWAARCFTVLAAILAWWRPDQVSAPSTAG